MEALEYGSPGGPFWLRSADLRLLTCYFWVVTCAVWLMSCNFLKLINWIKITMWETHKIPHGKQMVNEALAALKGLYLWMPMMVLLIYYLWLINCCFWVVTCDFLLMATLPRISNTCLWLMERHRRSSWQTTAIQMMSVFILAIKLPYHNKLHELQLSVV